LSTRDQLHQTVNHSRRESFPAKNLAQKIPIHAVIGLLKIKLEEKAPSLFTRSS
jgi:hypothetical protein